MDRKLLQNTSALFINGNRYFFVAYLKTATKNITISSLKNAV